VEGVEKQLVVEREARSLERSRSRSGNTRHYTPPHTTVPRQIVKEAQRRVSPDIPAQTSHSKLREWSLFADSESPAIASQPRSQGSQARDNSLSQNAPDDSNILNIEDFL
jgi:hypothetical protein